MKRFFGVLISIPVYIVGAIFGISSCIFQLIVWGAILAIAVGIIWFILSLFGIVPPP